MTLVPEEITEEKIRYPKSWALSTASASTLVTLRHRPEIQKSLPLPGLAPGPPSRFLTPVVRWMGRGLFFKSGCSHLRAELSRSGHQCARLGKHHAWKQVLLVLAHRCAQHCGWEEKCWEMGMLHNLRPLVPSSPRSGQGKTGKYGKVWKNTESAKHSPKTCETLKDTGFFDFAHLFG